MTPAFGRKLPSESRISIGSTPAFGRKLPSESRISIGSDVRFTPESGRL
jgi:hypothetical protein